MMGADTLRSGSLKGHIGMVIRFIDFMDQGWPIVGALPLSPMASGTKIIKFRFAFFKFSGQRFISRSQDGRQWYRRILSI
jgi:hypothetical protein